MNKKQIEYFNKHFSKINLKKIISSINELEFFNGLGVQRIIKK